MAVLADESGTALADEAFGVLSDELEITMTASASVPGSMTGTGNPQDVASHPTTSGRCPRCERFRWEQPCGGVLGTFIHLGG